jgi:hypothetical protein
MKAFFLLSATAAAFFWLQTPGEAASQESRSFQGWEALSAVELGAARGGESPGSWSVSHVDMGADLRDNTVVNSNSGDNLASDGAFAGAHGRARYSQKAPIKKHVTDKLYKTKTHTHKLY